MNQHLDNTSRNPGFAQPRNQPIQRYALRKDHKSMNQALDQPIARPTNTSINQPTRKPTNQSLNQSIPRPNQPALISTAHSITASIPASTPCNHSITQLKHLCTPQSVNTHMNKRVNPPFDQPINNSTDHVIAQQLSQPVRQYVSHQLNKFASQSLSQPIDRSIG